MIHTLRNITKKYIKDYGKIDTNLFRDICSEFNMLMVEEMLDGKEFNMGNNLSSLSIVRRERDPRSPRIDWGESNKYKQELIEEGKDLYNADTNEGTKWHIYHTDGFYCNTIGKKVSAK